MSNPPGVLWVMATPIGNLRDVTLRALDVLGSVEWLAAEDTRRSRQLLEHYSLRARTISLHEYNEAQRIPRLLRLLDSGYGVALVSDAGTPLLSDPGCRLVAAAHEHGIRVVPIPGPSSLTAALSSAGISADRFVFEGFLPAKATARRKLFDSLVQQEMPTVFFESPHRLLDSLRDLLASCQAERTVVVARELTKVHETLLRGSLADVVARVEHDVNQQRGEFVVIVAGKEVKRGEDDSAAVDVEGVLRSLLKELPLKQAVRLAAEITGSRRNKLYQRALQLVQEE